MGRRSAFWAESAEMLSGPSESHIILSCEKALAFVKGPLIIQCQMGCRSNLPVSAFFFFFCICAIKELWRGVGNLCIQKPGAFWDGEPARQREQKIEPVRCLTCLEFWKKKKLILLGHRFDFILFFYKAFLRVAGSQALCGWTSGFPGMCSVLEGLESGGGSTPNTPALRGRCRAAADISSSLFIGSVVRVGLRC